ncbi:MAG: hypothetical protein KME15_11655 [Drouetiella hepatica Uher 2000/2452]|jgi:hypothetical protein|uniref:Uncharacterized protein n=1 Tax=Drouetiella hepatica Uher 2000/2452 TaxID=904376 RepID=A0A951Q9P9_9CYAN|nr:hypothetical protein [Drouetiella hepatica Uher 2000/2452]
MTYSRSRKSLHLGENLCFFMFTAAALVFIKAGEIYLVNSSYPAEAPGAEPEAQEIFQH